MVCPSDAIAASREPHYPGQDHYPLPRPEQIPMGPPSEPEPSRLVEQPRAIDSQERLAQLPAEAESPVSVNSNPPVSTIGPPIIGPPILGPQFPQPETHQAEAEPVAPQPETPQPETPRLDAPQRDPLPGESMPSGSGLPLLAPPLRPMPPANPGQTGFEPPPHSDIEPASQLGATALPRQPATETPCHREIQVEPAALACKTATLKTPPAEADQASNQQTANAATAAGSPSQSLEEHILPTVAHLQAAIGDQATRIAKSVAALGTERAAARSTETPPRLRRDLTGVTAGWRYWAGVTGALVFIGLFAYAEARLVPIRRPDRSAAAASSSAGSRN
jgi:hypothetical protein